MPVETKKVQFPLRHLSVRVPWHDAGWVGSVCSSPELNGACAKLKGIAAAKKDSAEVAIAGRILDELPREQWPCCVDERATFMAPFEMEQLKRHALANQSPKHYGHFAPTPQRYPPYSAGIVPYFWMMKDNLEALGETFDLDVDSAREPDLGYPTSWVHEAQNQTALLNGFAAHLRVEDSLCFFYAKHAPFYEGTGRIIVGAGRVRNIGPLSEYKQSGEGMRGILWERPIQHSIRPAGADGFLLPYHQLLRRAKEDPSLDLAPYVAHAPPEHWNEFSYASELVTHDGAIAALLSIDAALNRIEMDLSISSGSQRAWIKNELVRLWKVRGPFPGLGAVLSAFGLSRGIFLAHALQQKAGENKDPWPLLDAAFRDPGSVPKELRVDLKELASTWKGLSPVRRKTLRLLSRFELTTEQAEALYEEGSRKKAGWAATDAELIANPYRIYEISRHDPEGVKLLTIDRGVFPEDVVRLAHPLEEPSGLGSAADVRRTKAFAINALEEAAAAGHTLHYVSDLAEKIASAPARPACPATSDILTANSAAMGPDVKSVETGSKIALQLSRYHEIRNLVQKHVLGRVGGQRHSIKKDWAKLLEAKFGPAKDKDEKDARAEKGLC